VKRRGAPMRGWRAHHRPARGAPRPAAAHATLFPRAALHYYHPVVADSQLVTMDPRPLADDKVDNYRFRIGGRERVPIVIGGMGVDISTAELALVAARLGGVGHISDAMVQHVSDRKYETHFTKAKSEKHRGTRDGFDKTGVKFDLEHLRQAQLNHVRHTMDRKQGDGAVFINVMEKLTMGAPGDTLRARLLGAMDGGIDGITLSAGLHIGSLKLMEDHPRFRDVKIGPIVSSVRALKIFLKSAARLDRLPDYVVVEGPLAGGHLGFGDDWRDYDLRTIVAEVLAFLRDEQLDIPVVPAGGIFTGTDAASYLAMGAAAVQVATRFTVTEECGLPARVKQEYYRAREEDLVVSGVSPTGYPIRLLSYSPCFEANIKPQCEAFGYLLSREGTCSYLDAYEKTGVDAKGHKLPVQGKVCLCYHFAKFNCYTCGHYVYRLKDTTQKLPDGSWQLLTAEHVFRDYQFSTNHRVALPEPVGAAAVANL
jgi:nitronate monooxygenase